MTVPLPDPAGATRLILVRHAEPSEAARCYGRLDIGLSGRGRAHAETIGRSFASSALAGVYSSPLRRAVETAVPIAAAHGLEPVRHPGLAELDFGELEGRLYDEIALERPDLYRAWMTHPASVRFPGGESFADLRARALAACDEVRRRHERQTAAIVAHGGVTRAILAAALGLADRDVFRLDQSYGGVSVVDWFGEAPLVRVVNARPAA